MTFSWRYDIISDGYLYFLSREIDDFLKGKYYGNFLQWFMENVN